MNLRKLLGVLAWTIAIATPAIADDFYISAKSVYQLQGDLSSVSPAVLTPSNAASYLDSGSALGYYGPIGPYGPLGQLGPVGNNTWNTSYWISAIGDWSVWADELTVLDGPLSSAGPLGPEGPLSTQAYEVDLPAINDFGKQLQAGGVWSVLGPVGPLGVLGPLGPLGPVGAHGFATDSCGAYVANEQVQRTVSVPYEGASRVYELYENYRESCAKAQQDNDTSFMVEGYISYPYSETDVYEFTSNSEQFITIVLMPVYTLDDFDLVITDVDDKVIASSNTGSYIDWVQLSPVPAGTRLKAKVRLFSTYHAYPKDYRLFVTGSTEYINSTDISGDHQFAR